MHPPKILLVVLVAVGFLGGCCSTDATKSSAAPASSTSAKPAATTLDPAATTTPITIPPVDDSTFGSIIAKSNSALDAAGSDTCKLVNVLTSFPSPATVAQTKQLIAFAANLFTALGKSLPAAQKADADAMLAAAASITTEAAALGFDPKKVADGSGMNALKGPAFLTAIGNISRACVPK